MDPAIYNMLEPTVFSVEGIDEIKQERMKLAVYGVEAALE